LAAGFWERWSATQSGTVGADGNFSTADADGPPSPGGSGWTGGGGGTPGPLNTNLINPGTNLWLLIKLVNSNQAVVVSMSNTFAGSNYLLLAATNLLGPWVTNQSLLAPAGTNVTVGYPIGIWDANDLFFIGVQAGAPEACSLKWATHLVDPSSGGGADGGEGFGSSPAVSAFGPIIITSANSNIFAIDPIFGDVLWSVPFETPSIEGMWTGSAAVGSDGTIYAGNFNGDLYCFSPFGSTNWSASAGDGCGVYSPPAIGTNGLIYITSDQGYGTTALAGASAFNPNSTNQWFFQPQALHNGGAGGVNDSPVISPDGTVYFFDERVSFLRPLVRRDIEMVSTCGRQYATRCHGLLRGGRLDSRWGKFPVFVLHQSRRIAQMDS
jgi:hypothetical protein